MRERRWLSAESVACRIRYDRADQISIWLRQVRVMDSRSRLTGITVFLDRSYGGCEVRPKKGTVEPEGAEGPLKSSGHLMRQLRSGS